MKAERIFVDTNILVYAHDSAEKSKHRNAKSLLKELWAQTFPPAVSIQVLQEFYVTLVRKNISCAESASVVLNYFEWDVVENTRTVFLQALEEQARWKLSFWDASIIAAAREAKATTILSEDFNTEQDYGGIRIKNPVL